MSFYCRAEGLTIELLRVFRAFVQPEPKKASGIDGDIVAIDLSNGSTVSASSEGYPDTGIVIRGDLESTHLARLPQLIQNWIKHMKEQIADSNKVAVGLIPVTFVPYKPVSRPARYAPLVAKYATGKYGELREEFLRLPEVEQQLRKLLGDTYYQLVSSLTVPQEINLQNNILAVSGCLPHACIYQGAAVSFDLTDGSVVCAGLQISRENGTPTLSANEITIHGSNHASAEALPEGIKHWIASFNKDPFDKDIPKPASVLFK